MLFSINIKTEVISTMPTFSSISNFPNYFISYCKQQPCTGHIWSNFKQLKELNPSKDKQNRLRVALYKNKKPYYKRLHILMAETFIGPKPNGMECHNDGNPLNNHPLNLRYDTHKNNMNDMVKHGKSCIGGFKNNQNKLTDEDI